MTRKLFASEGNAPRVINIKNMKSEGVKASDFVSVMRPSNLGNPFKVGLYLSLSHLKTVLSKVHSFPEEDEGDDAWVVRVLPHCYRIMTRNRDVGSPLTRSEAISCYAEWIRVAVRDNPSIREEIVRLKGKVIGCCCKPKACHADEIVKVFKEIEKGLL